MNLNNLPKDMLVELVSTIREEYALEIEKLKAENEYLSRKLDLTLEFLGPETGFEECGKEGCKNYYIYNDSRDLSSNRNKFENCDECGAEYCSVHYIYTLNIYTLNNPICCDCYNKK